MEISDFVEKLEQYGVQSRTSGSSLVVKTCPSCGREKYKVLFRIANVDPDQPIFGRCQSASCGQNYSSFSYLLKLGVPHAEVVSVHGQDPIKAMKDMEMPEESHEIIAKPVEVEGDNDISGFLNIMSMPDHPAAVYAKSRGFNESLFDYIKMDIDRNAVVFVCMNKNRVISGYQRRFVVAPDPRFKTETSKGFKKDSLFQLPNSGDVVICEGPFTALAAWNWGFYAVATLGAAVGKGQMDKILTIAGSGRRILIAKENDDAGAKFYRKIAGRLAWEGYSCEVVLPEVGKDLNDSFVAKKTFFIKNEDLPNPMYGDFLIM